MKVLDNSGLKVFKQGDLVHGHLIIRLSKCLSAGSCAVNFKNYEDSCAGYRRVVSHEGHECKVCIWTRIREGVNESNLILCPANYMPAKLTDGRRYQ